MQIFYHVDSAVAVLTCQFSGMFQMSDVGKSEPGVDVILVYELFMTQGKKN